MLVQLAPLTMVQGQHRQLEKLCTRAVIRHADLRCVAAAFDELETGCFLSAAQATRLLEAANAASTASSSADLNSNELSHIICSRVLDKWNLNEAEHSQVACYYGWDAAYLQRMLRKVSFIAVDGSGAAEAAAALPAIELQGRVLAEQSEQEQGNPPIISRELQNRVLAHMGKADHKAYALAEPDMHPMHVCTCTCASSRACRVHGMHRYSHSSHLPSLAAQLIAKNLCAGTSADGDVDVCACCLESCHSGGALWTCKRCGNSLHATCHHVWARKCAARDGDEDDEHDEGYRYVTCPYCRAKSAPKRFRNL